MYIDLVIDGSVVTYTISRLVAKHFIDSYSEDKDVHHIDCNTMNNHASNLMCVTRKEHAHLHSS